MRYQVGTENFTEAVTETPVVGRVVDLSLNSSNKTFTVPNGEMWHLNSVYIELTSTATAGNRQIVIEVKNTDAMVVGRISAGATQAASLTRRYLGMQGTYRETAFINTDIQLPIPADSFLPAGFSLHVYDSAAIDAAADDMAVSVSVKKYKGA